MRETITVVQATTDERNLAGAIHEYTRDMLGWKGRIPTVEETQTFITVWLNNCKKKLVNV